MTHFWEPLPDDAGAELFGTRWPRDANTLRLQAFIARANEPSIDSGFATSSCRAGRTR